MDAKFKAERDEALRRCLDLCGEYGGSIPQRIQDKIDAIAKAPNPETAETLIKKVQSSMLFHLLSQWQQGNIRGPVTKNYVLALAGKAEGMAKSLEARELDEAANKQWRRSDLLRDFAEGLENNGQATGATRAAFDALMRRLDGPDSDKDTRKVERDSLPTTKEPEAPKLHPKLRQSLGAINRGGDKAHAAKRTSRRKDSQNKKHVDKRRK